MDLAPANFFLFLIVKAKLVGLTLMQETFKNTCEGVVRSIAKEDFTAAFRCWRGTKSASRSAATMSKNDSKYMIL